MANENRKRELFLRSTPPELRSADGEPAQIVGYAAVFNTPTDIFWFREQIAPGAFTRTLKEKPDVRALFDHDSGKPIGRTTNGSLSLREDQTGLSVEITPPETTVGKDTIENVRSGLVTGMSFGFNVVTDEWSMRDGKELRTIHDLDLWEVSVVTFPAYEAAQAQARDRGCQWADPKEIFDLRTAQKEAGIKRRQAILGKRIAWYEKMLYVSA